SFSRVWGPPIVARYPSSARVFFEAGNSRGDPSRTTARSPSKRMTRPLWPIEPSERCSRMPNFKRLRQRADQRARGKVGARHSPGGIDGPQGEDRAEPQV